VPTVSVEDLEKRGGTEIVRLAIVLHTCSRRLGPEVKKMLSPKGQVSCRETTNEIVLIDSVATLREIVRHIRKSRTSRPLRQKAPEETLRDT